jgi:hypothetical protein
VRARRRLFLAPLALAVLGTFSSYAADEAFVPGYSPATDSDEAGLWMSVDRAELFFKQSPLTVRDEDLNAYVKEILC